MRKIQSFNIQRDLIYLLNFFHLSFAVPTPYYNHAILRCASAVLNVIVKFNIVINNESDTQSCRLSENIKGGCTALFIRTSD